jgi:RNase H-fold protein (predicted Holliday junction resolvase)
MDYILAIDPGREKCGLAVLSPEKKCVARKLCLLIELGDQIVSICAQYKISIILIGNGTHAKPVQKEVAKLELSANIMFVPEKNSSLEARSYYWKANPPRGLRKLIPTSLRVPPVPVDDFAAQILAERFLKTAP